MFFPDTTEADKIKKRKRLYGIFIAAVYHIWKNSMQSIDTVELESTNGGGFFFNKTRKKGKNKNKKKKKT